MTDFSLADKTFMMRCVQLAKNGLGTTTPNPMVGCVIVYNNKIIGEGWHYASGQPHAEVMAIRSVKNPELLSQATLYVSLEPCSYTGKTPPCSDLIIEKRIPRVRIGSTDPHPNVSGKGIERLRKSGIEVISGLCKTECDALNKRFFTFHIKKRPYVLLKWAATKDGFIAPETQEQGKAFWISSPISKQQVHLWRSQEASILVGTNTAIKDNPKLNTREVYGKNPVRLCIDKDLKIPASHYLLQKDIPSVIFTYQQKDSSKNLTYFDLDKSLPIPQQILEYCYQNNLQSILIEGGMQLLQSFIDASLWDEARVFTGRALLHKGIPQPKLNVFPYQQMKSGTDSLSYYKNPEEQS